MFFRLFRRSWYLVLQFEIKINNEDPGTRRQYKECSGANPNPKTRTLICS